MSMIIPIIKELFNPEFFLMNSSPPYEAWNICFYHGWIFVHGYKSMILTLFFRVNCTGGQISHSANKTAW